MISEDALVIYKTKPALVKEIADGKFSISLADGSSVKVRDKDIELIHPGPVKNFSGIYADVSQSAIREAWELLLDEGAPVSLKDLAALVCGEYNPSSAYAAYCLLKDGLYFSGAVSAITPRSRDEATAEEGRRAEKQRDTDERLFFLERIKACLKKPSANPLPSADLRFMQDVEALAYGKSAKSRTMKELGLSETPEDAHDLLLNTGLWTAASIPIPPVSAFHLITLIFVRGLRLGKIAAIFAVLQLSQSTARGVLTPTTPFQLKRTKRAEQRFMCTSPIPLRQSRLTAPWRRTPATAE